MKLIISGDINKYYVQTLCMLFFPGAKFGEDEVESFDNPTLELKITEGQNGVYAYAELRHMGKICSSKKFEEYSEGVSAEKSAKIAASAAVLAAAGELTGYRPSWGMLTGVRPAKVAFELLRQGMSKTRVKKIMTSEYFVIPKKAALATEVALTEKRIIGTPDKRDCSVYISIPFCPTRCAYCSFVSYTSKRLLSLIPEYLDRLCREIREMFAQINELGLKVKTVYIGGGTPTILEAGQLERLLGVIAECTDISRLEEYTLEAGRPDTITAEKLRIAIERGITRVCVNPQTLSDDVLSGIGRAHTAEDFFRAYAVARESGIRCVNTDLIAGLPGDRFATFSDSFDKILQLRPENITVHTFCVKKASEILKQGSHVYSRQGGDAGKCVDYSQIKSMQAGYKPYYMYRQKNTVGNFENVGFSLEGYEGLYNIYMMEEVHTIFAAGAGAVTKLVRYDPEGSGTFIMRLFNPKYPYEYLAEDRRAKINAKIAGFYAEIL
ncbi:MAG: coproporphyrinogen dehydrogenase HemZ [Eubacteriales bacterium]|jgi:oxygen-independent coproporphyrinogen-3 oxidase